MFLERFSGYEQALKLEDLEQLVEILRKLGGPQGFPPSSRECHYRDKNIFLSENTVLCSSYETCFEQCLCDMTKRASWSAGW